jgi:alanine racemase
VVENTLDALQQFAALSVLFEFPVIGLTGSNGKTIKGMAELLLSPDFNDQKSKVTIHR